MGGLLIILSVLISTILWGDLSNNFVWIANLTIIIFGIIGFADDYKKIKLIMLQGYLQKLELFFKLFLRYS